jgi:hypothetical protein
MARDDYDAYVTAVVMERRVAACQARSPALYARFAPRITRWRAANRATIQRLDPPAHRWQLPGGQSLDSLLAAMAESADEDMAPGAPIAMDARCERVLGIVAASSHASERW